MNTDLLIAYIIASMIIVAIPGPNILLIINDSVKHGFQCSLLTIIGIKVGISVLFAISLSGLTALLTLFSSLFLIIKWIGAGYLIYLGVSQIVASFGPQPPSKKETMETNSFFLKGFLVSVTNPKGLLFAGAFFPQFIDPQLAIGPQVLILCGGFLIISFLIEALYAFAGDQTGKVFKSEPFKRMVERISGGGLVLFGIGLSLMKANR